MEDFKIINKKIDYLNRFIENLMGQTVSLQSIKENSNSDDTQTENSANFAEILNKQIKFNYPQ